MVSSVATYYTSQVRNAADPADFLTALEKIVILYPKATQRNIMKEWSKKVNTNLESVDLTLWIYELIELHTRKEVIRLYPVIP
jgi:hypothetical protein